MPISSPISRHIPFNRHSNPCNQISLQHSSCFHKAVRRPGPHHSHRMATERPEHQELQRQVQVHQQATDSSKAAFESSTYLLAK